MKVLLSFCIFLVPILAAPYESKLDDSVLLGDKDPSFSEGGDDFNVGPSDVAHEEHAKLEEAAQKALNIIEHAGKYMDESIKEQSRQSESEPYKAKDIEPYKAKEYKKSDDLEKYRKKRQATDKYPQPVPQTDSEAAIGLGSKKVKREISDIDGESFEEHGHSIEDIETAAVKDESEEPEKPEEPEEPVDVVITEKPTEVKGTGKNWWEVESGLTPSKLDAIIDTVNKLNDVFATFIERYDSFHGTTAHKGTEPKQVDTTEKPVETSDEATATPEKSTKEAPESSTEEVSEGDDVKDPEDETEGEDKDAEDKDTEDEDAEDKDDEDEDADAEDKDAEDDKDGDDEEKDEDDEDKDDDEDDEKETEKDEDKDEDDEKASKEDEDEEDDESKEEE